MTALLSPKVWIALALAAALAFSHVFVYRAGRAAIRSQWDQQIAKDVIAARAKEQQLQDQANESEKAKDEQIQTINARLDAALGELRKRPQRPAVMPKDSGAGCRTTGAGLYRDDGDFLARLAARADAIAAERDACYRQYQSLQPR